MHFASTLSVGATISFPLQVRANLLFQPCHRFRFEGFLVFFPFAKIIYLFIYSVTQPSCVSVLYIFVAAADFNFVDIIDFSIIFLHALDTFPMSARLRDRQASSE